MATTNQHRFKAGDVVELLSVPDWLVADLPESEREAILACVGKRVTITDVDQLGSIWVGFGATTVDDDDAVYRGQSFVVQSDTIKLVQGSAGY